MMKPSKKELIVENTGLKTKIKELQKKLLQTNKDSAPSISKETLKLIKGLDQRSRMLIKSIDDLDPIPGNVSEYPCHYKKDREKMFLAGKGEQYVLVIKDQEKCFRMIIDILRQTGATIKKTNGNYVICKERTNKQQKYAFYVKEVE